MKDIKTFISSESIPDDEKMSKKVCQNVFENDMFVDSMVGKVGSLRVQPSLGILSLQVRIL